MRERRNAGRKYKMDKWEMRMGTHCGVRMGTKELSLETTKAGAASGI